MNNCDNNRIKKIILRQENIKSFFRRLSNRKKHINLRKSLYRSVLDDGVEKEFTGDKLYIDYCGISFILVNNINHQMLVNIDKELIKI